MPFHCVKSVIKKQPIQRTLCSDKSQYFVSQVFQYDIPLKRIPRSNVLFYYAIFPFLSYSAKVLGAQMLLLAVPSPRDF